MKHGEQITRGQCWLGHSPDSASSEWQALNLGLSLCNEDTRCYNSNFTSSSWTSFAVSRPQWRCPWSSMNPPSALQAFKNSPSINSQSKEVPRYLVPIYSVSPLRFSYWSTAVLSRAHILFLYRYVTGRKRRRRCCRHLRLCRSQIAFVLLLEGILMLATMLLLRMLREKKYIFNRSTLQVRWAPSQSKGIPFVY